MLSINPPTFWQIANLSFQHPINLSDDDDNPLPGNLRAEIFNNALANVLTCDLSNNLPLFNTLNYPKIYDITGTTSRIVNTTQGLKVLSDA